MKFEHTVGSHSDDRGGDSDVRCTCQDSIVICGYCYHGNTDEEQAQHCPFRRGSHWDLDGIYAPNSCPLRINPDDWIKTNIGRWTIKEKI